MAGKEPARMPIAAEDPLAIVALPMLDPYLALKETEGKLDWPNDVTARR